MSAPAAVLSDSELDAYLARIGFTGVRATTFDVLAQIQHRHVCTIPFENLDIQLGRGIRVDLPSVVRKIVGEKRGGYCFEQNTLLRAALLALGFKVTPFLARVRWLMPPTEESALTHLVLVVDLDGHQWLVDGGFGSGSLTAPLRLDLTEPQPTPHEPRRILLRDGHYVQQTKITGEWSDLYLFLPQPSLAIDLEVGNWYTSTWPQSRFVLNLVAARADVGLRYTLLNREFSIRHVDGRVEKRTLATPEEVLDVLAHYFHLEFPPGTRFAALR